MAVRPESESESDDDKKEMEMMGVVGERIKAETRGRRCEENFGSEKASGERCRFAQLHSSTV